MADITSEPRPIRVIAEEIADLWDRIPESAAVYLGPMHSLEDANSNYISESGASIVRYFLVNAGGFRGADARRLKAELKAHLPNNR